MSPAATFHAQLASIMEVLANTAVAEICELVDSGYSVLQLEISRSRKENEVLRRKLRLMELRAARANALRAAATAGGTAPLYGTGRARAPLLTGTPTGGAVLSRVSNQERPRCRNRSPSSNRGAGTTQRTPLADEGTAVIKVEDDDDDEDDSESWTRAESDRGFCPVAEGQTTEAESSSPLVKQEAADNGGVSSWTIEEVSSTSTSSQKTPSSTQRAETSSYDHLMFEPQLQHGSHTTQNPLGADPGCSSDPGSFPFGLTELTLSVAERQQPAAFHSNQQRAAPPADELTGSQSVRRQQDGVGREDTGGRSFVCNRCGKTLACLKNLKTHMRVHTGEKPFVCGLCGKRFSDSSNLKRHQSVHTGEKRYSCVHCGKRFAQSGSLKVHMTVHTDCKQFRCSFCGKTFISGSHLRRHVIVHAGERRPAATAQ